MKEYTPYTQEAIHDKYNKINHRGVELLLKNPESINLNRFSDNSYNGFNLSLFLTDESMQQITALLKNIDTIAQGNKMSIIKAGRDFPAHATLADGRYTGEDRDIIELYRYMQNDSNIVKTSQLLTNLQIPFNHLLIDGANVLLAADEIPKAIVEAREYFDEIYDKYGIKRKQDMRNILHITLTRATQLPQENIKEHMTSYLQKMRTLRREVSASPIVTLTVEPYIGPVALLLPLRRN